MRKYILNNSILLIDPQIPKRMLKSDIRELVRIKNSIASLEKKKKNYKFIISILCHFLHFLYSTMWGISINIDRLYRTPRSKL